MRKFIAAFILLSCTVLTAAQNEQAPITEKAFEYKDWVYKDVVTGRDVNLRKFLYGKKLVMVVYWAPWCPNWKYDAEFVEGLYEKYRENGFDVIGVGEYDPLDAMKASLSGFSITFRNVYESVSRADREKTVHHAQRRLAGDLRKWGSPWYVFLEAPKIEPEGMVLQKKVNVVNGELIRDETERFIREKLGLDAAAVDRKNKAIEICDPKAPPITLQKPCER